MGQWFMVNTFFPARRLPQKGKGEGDRETGGKKRRCGEEQE